MKTLISLIISLLFLMPVTAMADISESDSKQIDQAFSGFMQKVNDKKYDDAYTEFMLPLISEQGQLLRNLVGMTKQVSDFFVEPIKYEKISENAVGNHLVSRQYLLYNNRAPYIISIVMFRTEQGWKGQHIILRDLTPDDVAP